MSVLRLGGSFGGSEGEGALGLRMAAFSLRRSFRCSLPGSRVSSDIRTVYLACKGTHAWRFPSPPSPAHLPVVELPAGT